MDNRLKEWRKKAGLTLERAAEGLDISASQLSRMENGWTFPIARLDELAALYGCQATDLIAARPSFGTIDVVGAVQAGDWVEAFEWPEDDRYAIALPVQREYRAVPVFGLEVRGPSMNELYEDGDIVVCARFDDLAREPQPRERVVAQRTDRDGRIEATVKEFVVEDDGSVWLWPRSTDPKHQQPYALRPGTRDRSSGGDSPSGGDGDSPSGGDGGGTEPGNGGAEPEVFEVAPDEFQIVALVIGSYRRE